MCAARKYFTPSTTPARTIGRAPRTPSSPGWKMSRMLCRRRSRRRASSRATPSPMAAWPSCAQAWHSPALSEAKPSRAGKCASSGLSSTSTASMSKRRAVSVGRSGRTSATRPVIPPILSSHAGLAPCCRAVSRRARCTAASGVPMRDAASDMASPRSTAYPAPDSFSARNAVVQNSESPDSA